MIVKENFEIHRWPTAAIFSVEDRYARDRGLRGGNPQPFGPLKFFLLAEVLDNAQTKVFKQPLELIVKRNPSGYYLFFNEVKLHDGNRFQRYLSPGTYKLRVESRFYQALEEKFVVEDPPQVTPLTLQPNYAYPFPDNGVDPEVLDDCTAVDNPGRPRPTLLRGGLFHTDGRGFAGATVKDPAQQPNPPDPPRHYVIDASGQWILDFPSDQETGPVTIRFQPPGTPPPNPIDVQNVCVVKGSTTYLAQTALRGWVVSESGVGIAGATITNDAAGGESTSADDGSWFYYFDLNHPQPANDKVNVTVELPDGRSQTKESDMRQRATVVVPTFRFD